MYLVFFSNRTVSSVTHVKTARKLIKTEFYENRRKIVGTKVARLVRISQTNSIFILTITTYFVAALMTPIAMYTCCLL